MKQTLIIFMFFGFLFAEDNIAKYKVKGMKCSESCPVKITQAINKIDGVKTSEVNFDQKTAYILKNIQGMPYRKISKIMEKSVSSIESLIFRAKKNLKTELEKKLNNKK